MSNFFSRRLTGIAENLMTSIAFTTSGVTEKATTTENVAVSHFAAGFCEACGRVIAREDCSRTLRSSLLSFFISHFARKRPQSLLSPQPTHHPLTLRPPPLKVPSPTSRPTTLSRPLPQL